jgi:hypothetical protein
MLWISYEPIAIVAHYLRAIYNSIDLEIGNREDIEELFKAPLSISLDEEGNFTYLPRHVLLDGGDSFSIPSIAPVNEIYICGLDRSYDLGAIEHKQVGVTHTYTKELIKDRAFILEGEAYEYLLDRYRYRPNKLLVEMDGLLLLFLRTKKRLGIEEVMAICGEESIAVASYLQHIGSKEGSSILLSLEGGEAWRMVSSIYRYLIKRSPELYAYISSYLNDIREGYLDPRYGLVCMNETIRERVYIDRTNKSNWNIDIKL